MWLRLTLYSYNQYVYSLSFSDIEMPEPSKEEIAINAERKGMEKKMNTLFKYILFHMLFMAAMLLISTGNQDVWNFRQNSQLRQMFLTDKFKAVSLHAKGLSLLFRIEKTVIALSAAMELVFCISDLQCNRALSAN